MTVPLSRETQDAAGRIQPVAIGNCLSDSCTVPRLRPALPARWVAAIVREGQQERVLLYGAEFVTVVLPAQPTLEPLPIIHRPLAVFVGDAGLRHFRHEFRFVRILSRRYAGIGQSTAGMAAQIEAGGTISEAGLPSHARRADRCPVTLRRREDGLQRVPG